MKATIPVRSLFVAPQRFSRCTPVVRVAIAQAAPARQIQQRSFFSLADVAKLLPNAQAQQRDGDEYEDPNSQRFHARKILPYSQEQLYNIVADVPSYSQFIPFCASSSVITSSTSATPAQRLPTRQEPFDVEAELQVGFGNFSEKYTSRVQGIPFESVTAFLPKVQDMMVEAFEKRCLQVYGKGKV
ncbi:hypothetical protein QFC24_002592 [Naganishia onofrii]|uniref:Uncharacterized protein n=1 Tax=Naganishia onofrii TaxID=1851511 RepID=A0ACC2XQD7_9TREE|nr:hypothetical protein QFC24_002592 [Naganishia onofrii]